MDSQRNKSRRRLGLLAALCLLLPACEAGGHFTVLGYTTRPNYNTEIHTVRVPIFKNDTFLKGLEFDLTEAIIREIQLKSPYRVVPSWESADTELQGTIIGGNKNLVLFNPLGEIRDAETTLSVQVVWRDVRPGAGAAPLINPLFDPNVPIGPAPTPGFTLPGPVPGAPVPGAPPPVATPQPAQPEKVLVQSTASFRPELGESLATSNARMIQRMARQIVQMMELPY